MGILLMKPVKVSTHNGELGTPWHSSLTGVRPSGETVEAALNRLDNKGIGEKGEPGLTAYVHIRWGTSSTPSTLLTIPNEYIGIASTHNPVAPTNYTEYQWYQWRGLQGIKGDQGIQGVQGVQGKDAPVPIKVASQATWQALPVKEANFYYWE